MEAVRTHDKLYLKENRKLSPKESFKFIYSHSKKFIQGIENPRILDIGCATGDFLYYLSTKFPNAKLMGMDLMPDLIEVARKEVPKCEFILGNIQEDSQFQAEKFDAIFMVGVHPIFDECQPWIKNIISQLLKKNGQAFIFGPFNSDNVDIIVRARRSEDMGPWELGWNTFSIKTMSNFLNELNMNFKFYNFSIGIDIEKQNDPLRAWTVKLESGERLQVNGAGLVRNQGLLVFGKPQI
ncbi:MAG: class I SAM-dependent methyltransferase [Nitrospina sp.]|jgi:ubiquinone/menaquinone biosynthesis C-methylase UbiE|nr:class I SAM-dependent methyltransferase [Nitrospina sp.]